MSILCFLSIMSCAAKKSTYSTLEDSTKLIFLNYNAIKLDDEKIQVDLINNIEKEGKLKENNKSIPEGVSGDLYYHQLDKKSHVLHSTLIKNPFLKSFEYLDDDNAFNRKSIILDSVQFSLRLQRHPQAKYITISAFDDLEKVLSTVKLDH
ncbi:hypothetical protein [Changchengzhania lutea]|uniref:hypothetical protein n=1 Tax=Changchengzhania lutea TaxID=2049305 RepID=UPI00115DF12E|nr:hypothetical protein [Changchengzhania lutea]